MLEIFVTRYKEIHDGTIGKVKVVFNGELVMECFSLEPAGPDTIESNKDRRIPQGEYRLSRWVSKKYPQSLMPAPVRLHDRPEQEYWHHCVLWLPVP